MLNLLLPVGIPVSVDGPRPYLASDSFHGFLPVDHAEQRQDSAHEDCWYKPGSVMCTLRTSMRRWKRHFCCSALYLSGRSAGMKLPLLPVSTCELTSAGFVVVRDFRSQARMWLSLYDSLGCIRQTVVPLVITGRLSQLVTRHLDESPPGF
jgi:hypothetical protein